MRTRQSRSAKKAGSNNNKKKHLNGKRNAEVPLEDLVQAAEAAVTAFDVEQGIQLYSKAATLLRQGRSTPGETREWQLIRTLEKIGELKVSIGDQDGAVNAFREALEVLEQEEKTLDFYDTYSSIYMYIGQLSIEEEAKDAYEKGVACLESCMDVARQELGTGNDDSNSKSQMQELNRKLCVAYCAVAELYLTDLCYEDDAEKKCELIVEKALNVKDPDGEPIVDALQTMASLRLSQNSKRSEAATYILRAYEKMRVGCEALANLVDITEPTKDDDAMTDDDDDDDDDKPKELKEVDAANSLPEFEFRCQTAKLLLECAEISKEASSTTDGPNQQAEQCVSAAIAVLGSLLAQNDDVVEIWYLIGCAFAAKSPLQAELAVYYLQRAMEMLLDIKKSLVQEAEYLSEGEDDEIQDQLNQNEALIADVQSKLEQVKDVDPIANEST